MLYIHTIKKLCILCRVPKRDAEISGNLDIRIEFPQLACQHRTEHIIFSSRQFNAADH